MSGLRIQAVAGEGLVVVHPGGRVDRRAGSGEVTRVVLVDDPRLVRIHRAWLGLAHGSADAAGLLVFLAGRRPVLALRLADWLGCPNSGLDGPATRRVSGAVDLAAGLGVLVDHDDGSGIDVAGGAIRRVLVAARPRLPRWYSVLVALVAVGGPLVVALLAARGAPDETGSAAGGPARVPSSRPRWRSLSRRWSLRRCSAPSCCCSTRAGSSSRRARLWTRSLTARSQRAR